MAFSGKVILITGASSGIGAAIAIKFASEGASVAIVARNEDKLKNTYEKCDKSRAFIIVADLTNDEDVKRVVNDTVKHFGKLDVLVNNAGIGAVASIETDNIIRVFDQVMAVNLRSVVYITNLAVPHLLETKGNIINISSIVSTIPTSFAYCTSKAGLDHFSRCVALELGPKGVRVNNVNPGPVDTPFLKNMGFSEAQEEATWDFMKKISPLKRIGEADEIADLVLFLASDKARGITGSSFVSDNGIKLKGIQM